MTGTDTVRKAERIFLQWSEKAEKERCKYGIEGNFNLTVAEDSGKKYSATGM